jgi:hypothetical protein
MRYLDRLTLSIDVEVEILISRIPALPFCIGFRHPLVPFSALVIITETLHSSQNFIRNEDVFGLEAAKYLPIADA